jgi:hypothetical protein
MSQPESKLSRKIMKIVREGGGYAFKVQGGPTMTAGLPDIIICWRGLFVGIETKLPGEEASAIQTHVHLQIIASGGAVFIVRNEEEALRVLDLVETIATQLGLVKGGPQNVSEVPRVLPDMN